MKPVENKPALVVIGAVVVAAVIGVIAVSFQGARLSSLTKTDLPVDLPPPPPPQNPSVEILPLPRREKTFEIVDAKFPSVQSETVNVCLRWLDGNGHPPRGSVSAWTDAVNFRFRGEIRLGYAVLREEGFTVLDDRGFGFVVVPLPLYNNGQPTRIITTLTGSEWAADFRAMDDDNGGRFYNDHSDLKRSVAILGPEDRSYCDIVPDPNPPGGE